jgi:hypothetical protein
MSSATKIAAAAVAGAVAVCAAAQLLGWWRHTASDDGHLPDELHQLQRTLLREVQARQNAEASLHSARARVDELEREKERSSSLESNAAQLKKDLASVQQVLACVAGPSSAGRTDDAPTVRATWHAGGRDLEAEWMRERAEEPEPDPFG